MRGYKIRIYACKNCTWHGRADGKRPACPKCKAELERK